MNDLISRQAVRDLMYQTQCLLDEYDLDSIPSVDAVPMVYGHWEWVQNGWGAEFWACSNCHENPRSTWEEDNKINFKKACCVRFCPCCGAKMDEE